jgi:GTP:adenosylcobinamide-phosphate guanylyltransferase
MDAIVLAGGAPAPESPLYPFTKGKPKAALDIGGKPMLQWVLDALEDAETINRVVVVGCEDLGIEIQGTKVVSFQPDGNDMIDSFKSGADAILEINPAADRVAVVSSDIPLITPESINWVINKSLESDQEIYYTVIDQATMEGKYPGSSRSYTGLKDMNVCGGDLGVIKLDLYTKKKDFWGKITRARKSVLRMAAVIGIDILLLLFLRRLTLDETVNKVTRRLNITGKGLLCPHAEIGMDIDKPYQLELAQRELG